MKLPDFLVQNWKPTTATLMALLVVWVSHGAVPFVAMPTLGQAVWATGFAESLSHQGFLAVHATHFGQPEPAAIAFGLSGVLPIGWFITAGLPEAEAYSTMVAMWLAVALGGAFWLARQLGAGRGLSLASGVVWLTLPMVWWHAQYSMLALGMALLPAYHAAAFWFCRTHGRQRAVSLGLLVLAATVAVFMDGYTFMMFACGASLLLLQRAVTGPWSWGDRTLLLAGHAFAFGFAYLLYGLYQGQAVFSPEPLDFFRGWSLDIAYLMLPTEGVQWLWDAMGISVERSPARHFGDASVWRPTFLLPLLLWGSWACWYLLRRHERRRIFMAMKGPAWLAIGLLGLYLALGPTLKAGALKPAGEGMELVSHMSPEFGVAPTGTEVLSKWVPGFNNMRAAYRWSALGAFGFWALGVVGLSRVRGQGIWCYLPLALLVLSQWPSPGHFERAQQNREGIRDLDATLVTALGGDLSPGERVAFLPWGNDFLVNYLAARLELRAYNIGGDKNLRRAREHWPSTLKAFPMGRVDDRFGARVETLLGEGTVDVVVLPYYDMLWAAHTWPDAPRARHEALEPVVAELAERDTLKVLRRTGYAVVRLAHD